jgi:dienelactone hydrolase
MMLCALVSVPSAAGAAKAQLGPFGPQSPRMREQLWIVPSGDPARVLRATVFRPDDGKGAPAKRPLVVINHGTSESTRLSVSMPVFYWLSRWFVDRGYVVVLPQRRGHGATGGALSEDIGSCAKPEHYLAGQIAADDVQAVIDYMTAQPFIAPQQTVVVGVSTGGWASLALAARRPANVRAVVNFAGGRGGHAHGTPNVVCGERELVEAAASYARTARIPTIWFYAKNDSYFGPKLARRMAAAWNAEGGSATLDILEAYGDDGHELAADQAGWGMWGAPLEAFLEQTLPVPMVASEDAPSRTGTTMPATLAGAGEDAR